LWGGLALSFWLLPSQNCNMILTTALYISRMLMIGFRRHVTATSCGGELGDRWQPCYVMDVSLSDSLQATSHICLLELVATSSFATLVSETKLHRTANTIPYSSRQLTRRCAEGRQQLARNCTL
jgi:hypothetical protein